MVIQFLENYEQVYNSLYLVSPHVLEMDQNKRPASNSIISINFDFKANNDK